MKTIGKLTRMLTGLVLGATLAGAATAAPPAEDDIRIVGSSARTTPQSVRNGASGTELRTATVSYADLDLAADAGVRTLYARIELAANKVCGPRESREDFRISAAWSKCFAGAMDDAVAQVDNARLAQLHRHETGRGVAVEPQVAATH